MPTSLWLRAVVEVVAVTEVEVEVQVATVNCPHKN
jgi:hypothetical protein